MSKKEKTSISKRTNHEKIRKLTTVAVMSAIGAILMYIEISIPIMPSFIKLDFSELPALLTSFALGPVSGIAVCLIKNLLHLPVSSSMGIGELSNFLLGAAFVGVAGLIYKKHKTRKTALIGSLAGSVAMAGISVLTNYFIVYPVYTKFMPMEAIIGAYSAILPSIDSLIDALVIFNMPFTLAKGLIDVLLTFIMYKPLAPILKGTGKYAPKSSQSA